MTLCRIARPSPELEEEAFHLADEWAEIDTSLSLNEYIYYHASTKLKKHMDEIAKIKKN